MRRLTVYATVAASLVNDNAAATECGGRIAIVVESHLVVIDNGVGVVLVPDFDSELIHSSPTADLPVNRREQEAVVAPAVDCAGSLVLRSRARHDQPLVDSAMEVEIGYFELKLRFAGRDVGSLLVLRDEAEVCCSTRR